MNHKISFSALVVAALIFLGGPVITAEAVSGVMSDFDDGTLQGWTKGTPSFNPLFGGNLELSANGNPGGAMVAFDTVGAGGGLFASAPAQFTGDLSSFTGIGWDEFLPAAAIGRTSIALQGGSAGTVFTGVTADQATIVTGNWESRSIPFDFGSGLWILESGSDSFDNVLQSVTGLYIQMDVTTANFGSLPEASVDNVFLSAVPEPTSAFLLGTAVVGMLAVGIRPRTQAPSSE